ncbi:hypothetical protein LS482_12210 [Sinomicrobium kalidii]|uniref:Calx-beta domain-containing protein n=1 Tax=Sinomicrobium kalidii TaxID=2900738 RepID=UPI001E31A8FE|nr:Calx-beta domain-containing protein [Sinomicrobium kalidii]UGU14464.1 hypothetical protein LS482_12210 [Sinomicrobium kalidii]
MKSYIYNLTWAWCLLILITACSDDDHTGDSTLTASAPSLEVALEFNDNQTLIETETTYAFTVSISEPQIVDVVVNLEQTEGTATDGEDFSFPHQVRIPAGTTSASDEIAIHSDELSEETETAVIKIATGTESNVQAINSKMVTFNIRNLTSGDLAIALSWEASGTVTDHEGNEIAPTDLGDLRLLLTDVPYTAVIDSTNETAFETHVLTADTPDGEYYVVTDIHEGNAHIASDLNLTLQFDQVGIINEQIFTYDNAINTAYACKANYFIMAKVTKSGETYTFENVEFNNFDSQTFSWTGTDVVDAFNPEGYESTVRTTVDCNGMLIYGLNSEWMQTTWGEEIQEEGTVYYTLDEATGEVTIESQYIFTTLYEGVLYDYTVSGSGTYDDSGEVPTLTIQYYLDQDGFSPNQWMFDNGYMETNYFEATLTLEQ